ncbi:retrotransposon protein, putative, ty1-copia subclass [Tanacetum coccineum]
MGLWYPKDSGFELTAFSDADHVGCIDTRKSTSGGIQFLGDKLVSWMSKKHDCTAMSSAETEYVALSASCAQLNAMNMEMQSMKDNEVWNLVDLSLNYKIVGSKWLFKKKTDMDGAVHTYKARLVAKGFTQTYRVDYEETFSPVADIRAIRIFIAIAAFYDYKIWQMDVKTAFLNGHLYEEFYMVQHEASGSYVIFLILYVDDILIMGNNIPMLQDVKSYLGRCFAIKDLGEAAYILGIKIYQDRSKWLIGLGQSSYIEKILKRYFMKNSKRGTIPMQEKLKLSKSQGASTFAEKQRMKMSHTPRSLDQLCDVRIEKVDTDDNLVDPFTKTLAFLKHSKLTRNIGMIPASSLSTTTKESKGLQLLAETRSHELLSALFDEDCVKYNQSFASDSNKPYERLANLVIHRKFKKDDYGSLFDEWSNPILSMDPTSSELVVQQVVANDVEPEPQVVADAFEHEPREELVAEQHAIKTSVHLIENVGDGDPSFVVKELAAVKKMIFAIEKFLKLQNDDMSEDFVFKQFVYKELESANGKNPKSIGYGGKEEIDEDELASDIGEEGFAVGLQSQHLFVSSFRSVPYDSYDTIYPNVVPPKLHTEKQLPNEHPKEKEAYVGLIIKVDMLKMEVNGHFKEMALYSTEVYMVNKNEPPSSEKVIVKLLRKRNKGKALVEPYTETTRLAKCQKTKDTVPQTQTESTITIFGHDMKEIPLVEFQKDLSRAPYSRRRKVKFPECIDMVYALGAVGFWAKPTDADWAIASSYLCDFVMHGDIPRWVCNGVKYPVIWANVEEGILEAKCIPLESYNIKFVVGKDVPIQGDAYGDYALGWHLEEIHLQKAQAMVSEIFVTASEVADLKKPLEDLARR